MKKVSILLISILFLCSGCNNKASEDDSVKNYNSFINAVNTNKGIVSENIPFEHTLEVTKQKDDSYRYQVLINNPLVAMYNVQMIVVNPEVNSNDNIYPCIGLLGDDAKNEFVMVPFQSNVGKNYVKGISLDGVSKVDQFTLNVLVAWKDKNRQTTYRSFFTKQFALESNDQENGAKATSDNNENGSN